MRHFELVCPSELFKFTWSERVHIAGKMKQVGILCIMR